MSATPERFSLRPVSLIFRDREMEKGFIGSYTPAMVTRMRWAILLGLLLNLLFVFLDFGLMPVEAPKTLAIRFGLIVPSLLIVLALSGTQLFRKLVQFFGMAVLFIHGLGNALMAWVATMPGDYFLLAIIVITVFGYTFAVLRLVHSLIIGLSLFAMFEAMNFLHLHESSSILMLHNYYLISINLLGLIANWTIERHVRKSYAQSLVIEEESGILRRRSRALDLELNLARKIQSKMIPAGTRSESIAFSYRPMDRLGGDFIDLFPLESPTQTGVFISDVSGHGVPAAFITAMIKTLLLQAGPMNADPAGLMRHLNDSLCAQVSGHFVTALYGVHDSETGRFVFSSAGHPSPYRISPSGVRLAPCGRQGLPLGLLTMPEMRTMGKDYSNTEIVIGADEKLLLYTDGLTEATDARSTPGDDVRLDFEQTGLIASLEACVNLAPREVLDSLNRRLGDFRGQESFEDDICMICIRGGAGKV